MSDVLPDGLDEMDVFADEFERLGRAAGAELRRPAPNGGDLDVEHAGARRRTARAVTAVVALLVVAVGGVAWLLRPHNELTPATVPVTDPGWIVYVGATDARQELFLVRPDGTGAQALVPDLGEGNQSKPDWSPDRRRIVFTMPGSGGDELWVVNVDGSGATRLVECNAGCIYLDDPSWSPDGAWVAFARLTRDGDNAVGTLERVELATGRTEVLVTADALEFFAGPRWSPDGGSLVVEVVRRTGTAFDDPVIGTTVSVLDVTSAAPTLRPLTDPSAFAVTPDWNRSGDLIVYAAPPSPSSTGNDLFTVAPDGGEAIRLTFLADTGGSADFPSFTRDGSRVVFSAGFTSQADRTLTVVDLADGAQTTTLGRTSVAGTHPRP